MAHNGKRKEYADKTDHREPKRAKGKKTWTTPKQHKGGSAASSADPPAARKQIEPGDAGVWATCNKGREGKCVTELKILFQEYAERIYDQKGGNDPAPYGDAAEDVDAEIEKELEGIRKPSSEELFTSVRLDTPCIVFFKVRPPIEPVSMTRAICEDAAATSAYRKQSRSVKRLTPITLCGKATEKGLEEIAEQVLAPHFHQPGISGVKFAIRTNFRNHSILKRAAVIKQVAAAVGPNHVVDLESFDLLILVEVYQNICGMSVVQGDFEKLKKYNLAEIFEPTPAPKPAPQI